MPNAPTVPDLPFAAAFSPQFRTYTFFQGLGSMIVSILGIVLVPFWVLGLGQWYARKYIESMECELSSRHLRFKKGILFSVEHTIPLDNIQDLAFKEGPLLRYFQLSTLKVETAGQSGQGGSDMSITGIADADTFRRAVLAQRDRLTDRSPSPAEQVEDGEALRSERIEQLLIEIRDALREGSKPS